MISEALAAAAEIHGTHEGYLWQVVSGLTILVVAGLGYFLRVMNKKISDANIKIAALELKVAEEYVSVLTFKETIADFKRELHESFNPVYSRLTGIESYLRQRPPS